jgi:hypothetical protein
MSASVFAFAWDAIFPTVLPPDNDGAGRRARHRSLEGHPIIEIFDDDYRTVEILIQEPNLGAKRAPGNLPLVRHPPSSCRDPAWLNPALTTTVQRSCPRSLT